MIIWQESEETVTDLIQGERRRDRRHPIELELSYECTVAGRVVARGRGITRELSSRGLSFRADSAIDPGAAIELRINWPIPGRHLDLLGRGRVVRSNAEATSVRIFRYSFTGAGRQSHGHAFDQIV